MAQILNLLMLLATLGGLYVLLTRKSAGPRWGALGATAAIWVTLLLIGSGTGVAPSNMISFMSGFLIIAGIYSISSLGLNMHWGYTGLFNLGVAGFFGVGAYVSALLVQSPENLSTTGGTLGGFVATYFGMPFLVGLAGAMIGAGLVALIVGYATLRLRADYLAIATVGIAEVIRIVATNERWLTEANRGIPNIPQPLRQCLVIGSGEPCSILGISLPQFLPSASYNWFYLLLVVLVIVLAFLALQRIANAPWGRVLRSVREDEDASMALGKHTFGFKLQSFVVGAVIMGAAGSLFAHFVRFINPEIFDPVSRTFLVWVMLIVGGTGNNRGAILGAFLMWGVYSATNFLNQVLPSTLMTPWGSIDVASQLFGPIRIMAIVLILELILLYRPRGLLGEEKATSTLIESR